MANMSYCRFRNTAIDMEECINALEEEMEDISDDELKACKKMFRSVVNFLTSQGVDIDRPSFNEWLEEVDKFIEA